MSKKDETKMDVKSPVAVKDSTDKRATAIAKEYGVKKVYENSKGEYFIQYSNALNSEDKKADKIKTHNFK